MARHPVGTLLILGLVAVLFGPSHASAAGQAQRRVKQPVGLTVYKPDKCYAGYTLFAESYEDVAATADGAGEIYLVDMQGKVVHTWKVKTALQSFCRLLPNGNLLYPTRDRSDLGKAGLRELDPDSNIVWSYHCRIDHDYQVLANGHLLLHTIRDIMCPELGPELKRCPYMLEITRDKKLVWQWCGEQHMKELEQLLSPKAWQFVQQRIHGQFSFDWAHNNTCQIIPPNTAFDQEQAAGATPRFRPGNPRFRPGNIVFSYRSLDVIGVIDRKTGKIVWAWGPGELDGQHKPHMLANGHLLIFDNGTLRGYSRVIEVDPLTEKIVWEYTATPKSAFLSRYISSAQRLPNGNTLICEGSKAHLFEVTPAGEVVWNFVDPYHEPGGLHSVYRCLRYTPEYVEPLFKRIGHKTGQTN